MAGTVDTTTTGLTIIGQNSNRATFTFLCTGDASDGTIPDTDIPASVMRWLIDGEKNLIEAEAYPTAGGTAPDAADVFILDDTGIDLLGSEDNGTTAYEGLGLIHATLARRCLPNLYMPRAGLHVNYYPIIKNTLTLRVANQATVNANWTVVLTFQ